MAADTNPNPNAPLSPPGRPAEIAILGLGQMGLACAGILTSGDPAKGSGERPVPRVRIWGHDQTEAGRLSQTRKSDRLEGFTLHESVRVVLDDAELAKADLIVAAIPVQHIREALERLAPRIAPGTSMVSVAKGIENGSLLRPTQVIGEVLGKRPLGALSGPTIAAELARGLPATMIAASSDAPLAKGVQTLFSTRWLRVYTNDDLVGVELAGALKNVIAIAAGILDGLQAGNNAKSALLARGLAEITRLGEAMGARPDTFFGVAGVGDLATSCFSPEGRNRSCGEALGRGAKLDEYLSATRHVVEGVWTTRAVVDLALRHEVEMPIVESVHAVLFDGMDPIEAIDRLMSRELKEERIG